MQAIQNYMLHSNANTYGVFETSRRTNETILSARAAMADFFNCIAEEVVFGQNMTTITFALARAIGRLGPDRVSLIAEQISDISREHISDSWSVLVASCW